MKKTKLILINTLALTVFALTPLFAADCCSTANSAMIAKNKTTEIKETGKENFLRENKKTEIPQNGYFVYKFASKPAMGTTVLKIKVFDASGKQTNNLKITGNYGMPSMSGAHDSGEVSFQLNKKGDYLLPVNIVMPGQWQIEINIKNDTESLFSGKINVNI